ncbi:MAG: GNAT family N-acetyltransferase [Cyclobacteriaceae bacterium]|nr:GNAT family N-acetyltransferase [Cyclobacteriaceae bacterium]MCH8517452.1 GNAT family N-acetyltransferase [Cyclobacteriaceae bacterium]
MDSNIIIREYVQADQRELIHLLKLNTPQYFAQSEEEQFISYLRSEIESYYVLLYNQQVVGCGGINLIKGDRAATVSWDIIHPDFQGRSLGAALLKYRMEMIHSIPDVDKIIVRTSQLTYQFYEKNGFKLINTKKNYWAKGYDLYSMEYVVLK